MSKDPAVLFYTSDFITGTMLMTNEQRGMYILLLCFQHQQGFLSEEDMLTVCGGVRIEQVFSKFQKDVKGYFNVRMRDEAEKRANYTKGRKNNLKRDLLKKSPHMDSHMDSHMTPHMVTHMDSHMENENVNTSNNIGIAENFISKLSKDVEWVNKTAYSLGRETVWVSNMLNQRFKPHIISQKRNPPADIGEFARYFVNWARKQKDEIQTTYNDINSPPVNY